MNDMELSDQKPIVNNYIEIEVPGNFNDTIIKTENTLIKQNILDQDSEESCYNVYDSLFDEVKHELCDNSSGTKHSDDTQQQVTGSLFTSSDAPVLPLPPILATDTVFIKQEAAEPAEITKNDMSESDTQSFTIHHELTTSESPKFQYQPLTTVDELFSKMATNAKNVIVHTDVKKKRSILKLMRPIMGDKSIACNLCQYKSTRNSDLLRHMRTHTGHKPFGCGLCQQRFSDKNNLKRHIKNIHFK